MSEPASESSVLSEPASESSAPVPPPSGGEGVRMKVLVDGRPVDARPGQTVAGLLLGTGHTSWRTTRVGDRPRGVFCGIGLCFDCLVVVNGIPDVRACQRMVSAGDEIRTQHGAELPEVGSLQGRPADVQRLHGRPADVPVVVVVGGGPAGMAAARAVAAAERPVVLIDSAPALGGQFHRQDALSGRFPVLDGVEHLPDTVVVGLEPVPGGHRLHLRTGPADGPGRRAHRIDTPALVLATGAYDRALPFPGWELPGVYTAGAAQALAKGQRVAIGERVVVAGTGPFLLPVAESLIDVGARVLCVLEGNDPISGWLARPFGADTALAKLPELIRHLVALRAVHKVPYRPRHTVLAAHGSDRVEAVTIARINRHWEPVPGTEQRIEVDAVCAGFGFRPRLELAVAAGCAVARGFVEVDRTQATSVDGVFAAGEITGIGGSAFAMAEGTVAGTAAAARLGAAVTVPRGATRRVRAGRRFADALDLAYRVRPEWRDRLPDDTLICRCEEVRYGELRRAVEQRDVKDVRAVKLTTRAGLGMCQGRICGDVVAELTEIPCGAAGFTRRPIAEPLRLGELATTEEEHP